MGFALCTMFQNACRSSDGGAGRDRHATDNLIHGWVAPDGNDSAAGTMETPLATLRRAVALGMDIIHLKPGRYDEQEILLTRSVQIQGPTTGRALLTGHVFVSTDNIRIERVDLGGGLAAHRVQGLTIAEGRAASGVRDETLLFTNTDARLEDLEVTPGPEAGLLAVSSTLTLIRFQVRAREETERSIRIDRSVLEAKVLTAEAGTITHIQVADHSRASFEDVDIGGTEGSGLMILSSSTVTVERGRFKTSSRFGVIVQDSRARLTATEFMGATEGTVGVQGGYLQIDTSTIGPSPGGALVLSAHHDRLARVELMNTTIAHGPFDGARVSGGRLVAHESRFVGSPTDKPDAGSAAIAHGVSAHVDFVGVQVETPAGHGLVVTEDASARISGRIDKPGAGGLLIENVRVAPTVQIEHLEIDDCRTGSAIVAIDSEMAIDDLVVRGCPEAGVLSGARSAVMIRKSRITGPGRYGFAAFGEATLTIEDVRAEDRTWATFASCAEGARVLQKGENHLTGRVIQCP